MYVFTWAIHMDAVLIPGYLHMKHSPVDHCLLPPCLLTPTLRVHIHTEGRIHI